MIRPDETVVKRIAQAVQQYPELLDWLDGVREHELSRLPWAIENAALFQGRCQVLSELADMLRATPAMAAKV